MHTASGLQGESAAPGTFKGSKGIIAAVYQSLEAPLNRFLPRLSCPAGENFMAQFLVGFPYAIYLDKA